MASRRGPSQRNAEYAAQHRARQIQSMSPGTAGGRLASASPIKVGSDTVASFDTNSPEIDSAQFAYDTFALSGAAPTLSLSYVPADSSLHVYLNGLEQREGTDYTLSGLTLSVLAAMDTGSGDVLDARYAYVGSLSAVVSTVPGFYSVASDSNAAAPAGGTSSTLSALTFSAGDLLVVIAAVQGAAPTPPTGFTLLDSGAIGTADFRVWTKVATGSTDSLVVSGIAASYGVIAYAFQGGTLAQHAIAAPVAGTTSVAIASPSLTATASAYALHVFALRGDFSAAAIALPGSLIGTAEVGGNNVRVGAGLEVASAGVATTQTATGSSYAGSEDGRGAQILVNS